MHESSHELKIEATNKLEQGILLIIFSIITCLLGIFYDKDISNITNQKINFSLWKTTHRIRIGSH
jgi:hypothetical protein